jgi:hypothetical protein
MDGQLVLVVLLVALAAGYVGRQAWRTWSHSGKGCGSCGCGKNAASGLKTSPVVLIPSDQLTVRVRSGKPR